MSCGAQTFGFFPTENAVSFRFALAPTVRWLALLLSRRLPWNTITQVK